MAVGMDHDLDVVGIVEGLRASVEGRIVKVPGRGIVRPQDPGEASRRVGRIPREERVSRFLDRRGLGPWRGGMRGCAAASELETQ
jgi:hypothetical protein